MQLSSQTELSWTRNMHNSTAEAPRATGTCNETLSTLAPSSEFSLGVLVLLAFLMVLLALVTTLGNILVIFAFIMDRNLRHRSNYFFLNLAISDFAVGIPFAIQTSCTVSLWLLSIGAFCMPLYIPYSLTGKWHLGRGICKLWLLMDYLLCTASVFNIVLISYDRFLSVTKASILRTSCVLYVLVHAKDGGQHFSLATLLYQLVSYRAQRGITSNPVIKMAATWVFAFLLYCPAILFWEHVAGGRVVAADQCYAEFYHNWYFLLCASTLEFFVPLLSVTYFNARIFRSIQRRQRHGSTQDCEPARSGSLSWGFCLLPRPGASSSPSEAEDSGSSSTRPKKESLVTESSSPSRGNSVIPENDFSVSFCTRTRSKLQQDKKIAKSLAIIVCVFAICWAPYTLLMIIRGACRGTCVHKSLYEITFWLLWLNSALNPFLYPLCHVKFRMAFMKILCPKKFATVRSSSL